MIKSPFRYPGSKNKMIVPIMEHLIPLIEKYKVYCEPFIGGGSILLEIAEKYPKLELFANDRDDWCSSFWQVMSDPDTTNLNRLLQLLDTQPTIEHFYQLRETPSNDVMDCAYRALYYNRCCFSGIVMKDDKGMVKSNPIGGKNQKSKWKVDCRYNAKKLKEKVIKCHQLLAGRTTVECKDFSEYDMLIKSDYPAYCDPPYVIKGGMLYSENMSLIEHKQLANVLNKRNNWILSYDDCDEVREMYKNNQITTIRAAYTINGKKEMWKNNNELIIEPI